jgi:hypothetical protein
MSYTHPKEPDLEAAVRTRKSDGALPFDAEVALCVEIVVARVMNKLGRHISAALELATWLGSKTDIQVYATDGLDVVPESIAMALSGYFSEHSARCLSECIAKRGHEVTKHTFITKKLPDELYSAKLEIGVLIPLSKV